MRLRVGVRGHWCLSTSCQVELPWYDVPFLHYLPRTDRGGLPPAVEVGAGAVVPFLSCSSPCAVLVPVMPWGLTCFCCPPAPSGLGAIGVPSSAPSGSPWPFLRRFQMAAGHAAGSPSPAGGKPAWYPQPSTSDCPMPVSQGLLYKVIFPCVMGAWRYSHAHPTASCHTFTAPSELKRKPQDGLWQFFFSTACGDVNIQQVHLAESCQNSPAACSPSCAELLPQVLLGKRF